MIMRGLLEWSCRAMLNIQPFCLIRSVPVSSFSFLFILILFLDCTSPFEPNQKS
jgi:hypothetical protein